jgi:hypothetical protein
MAWPPGDHIETLIAQAQQLLADVRIIRHDVGLHRALIDLEGQGSRYRIIVSEVHRADGSVRYAYYVLDSDNRLVYGFDNSPDTLAIKLKYGVDWKSHLHEETPHQHDASGNLMLTTDPMTFQMFIDWLTRNTY